MFKQGFYAREELLKIGFKSIGNNVKVSYNASIYGAENIVLGNDVRIDDFCLLSGKIELGNNIHIAAYSAIYGGDYGVYMDDFTCLSSRCVVYAKMDDFSGEFLTNPTVPEEYTNVTGGIVKIGRHVIIGSGSTVMPNVEIGEGVAVGSMSLIRHNLKPWGIYVGIPCKWLKGRKRSLLKLEEEYIKHR